MHGLRSDVLLDKSLVVEKLFKAFYLSKKVAHTYGKEKVGQKRRHKCHLRNVLANA